MKARVEKKRESIVNRYLRLQDVYWRGHHLRWTDTALTIAHYESITPPECLACEDTGYEPGMPGYYCTFCRKGCAVAHAQMKAGIDPWSPVPEKGEERE